MKTIYTPQVVDLFGTASVDLAAAVASYSADRIGMSGSIRKPFRMDGADWVCVSTCGRGLNNEYKSICIYRLSTPAGFTREITTYSAKTHNSEAARRDVNGFYDGMAVKSGAKSYVLTGPEYELLAAPVSIALAEDDDAAEDDEAADLEDFDDVDLEDGDDMNNVCACGIRLQDLDNHYDRGACGFFCDGCIGEHGKGCKRCAEEWGYPIDSAEDEAAAALVAAEVEAAEDAAADVRRAMMKGLRDLYETSKVKCICGHLQKDHTFMPPHHACMWSEGTGKGYHDCECNDFCSAEDAAAPIAVLIAAGSAVQLSMFGGAA